MIKKNLLFGILLPALWYLTTSLPALAFKSLDIESFTKFPAARNLQISPDGKHLSIVFKKSGIDYLGVLDRKSRKVLKTFGVKGRGKSVGKVYWVNNERLVYSVEQNYAWNKQRFSNGELVGVNIDGTRHKLIFGYKAGEMQISSRRRTKEAEYGNQKIIDFLDDDKDNILIIFYPWHVRGRYWVNNENAKPIVYKLNVYTGQKRSVDYLPTPNASAITDNKGRLRFSIGVNDKNEHEVFYKEIGSNDWLSFHIKKFEGLNATPLSFTADNKSVYILANAGVGTRALYLFDLEKQSVRQVFHDEKVDIGRIIRNFSGKRVVAVSTELGIPTYHYLDLKDAKVRFQKILLKVFKGSNIVITSATQDVKFLVFLVYSDTNPGDYYLMNTENLKVYFVVSRKPNIDPSLMAKTTAITFKARDGQTLYGYLTGVQQKNSQLPLIVLPHGGPHGVRDRWGFDWEVQLLANRGYAVLQVNYRGSGGFGIQYQRDGYGEWGGLMQDDITDATKYVIKMGWADPKKICIYGTSYGGYAALMGAVREPYLYQCAIGSAGVYNLPMMFKEGDIASRKNGVAYLKDALGDDLSDQKLHSPVFNVEKIKANILLIHGTKDKRAPIEQAESLKKALNKIGKKYEWLEISNEGHGYYDEKNRLRVYGKILQFLAKNIGSK